MSVTRPWDPTTNKRYDDEWNRPDSYIETTLHNTKINSQKKNMAKMMTRSPQSWAASVLGSAGWRRTEVGGHQLPNRCATGDPFLFYSAHHSLGAIDIFRPSRRLFDVNSCRLIVAMGMIHLSSKRLLQQKYGDLSRTCIWEPVASTDLRGPTHTCPFDIAPGLLHQSRWLVCVLAQLR